jgi:hypothetical protein
VWRKTLVPQHRSLTDQRFVAYIDAEQTGSQQIILAACEDTDMLINEMDRV